MTGFSYVATPYTKYAEGLDAAFDEACAVTARLMRRGIPCFSPIAHSHPVAKTGILSAADHDLWMALDAPMMAAAKDLIVIKMPGWIDSLGVLEEIKIFRAAKKPVRFFTWPDLKEDTTAPFTVRDVEEVVRLHFGLTHEQMIAPSALRIYARPRHIAMLLSREFTDASYPALGRHFCRDHAAVWCGVKSIRRICEKDPLVAAEVEACRAKIRAKKPWKANADLTRLVEEAA